MFLLTDHKNGLTNEWMKWIGHDSIERQIPGIMALLPITERKTGPASPHSFALAKI